MPEAAEGVRMRLGRGTSGAVLARTTDTGHASEDIYEEFFDVGYAFSGAAEAERMLNEIQNQIGAPLMVAHDGDAYCLVLGVDDVYSVMHRAGSEFDHINSAYHYIGHYYIAGHAETMDRALIRLAKMRKTVEPPERKLMIEIGATHPYWNIAVQDLAYEDED